VVLYPNFANQSSLSTNHLERGEHVGGKLNALKHRPMDFTVPLLTEYRQLRLLWTTADPAAADPALAGRADADEARTLAPLAPLHALPTLDLFSEPTTQEALVAKGAGAVATHPGLATLLA
jgi:hypothetical protein